MSFLADIGPSTIAAVTLLALLVLAVEYFTRALSSGLGWLRRYLTGEGTDGELDPALPEREPAVPDPAERWRAGPRHPVPEPVELHRSKVGGHAPTGASRSVASDPPPAAYPLPPAGDSVAFSAGHDGSGGRPVARSHEPEPPGDVRPFPAELPAGHDGRERSAEAITRLVRDLERLALAINQARDLTDVTVPYSELVRQTMEYSVDDLMEISDEELSATVADYYRSVSAMLYQARRLLERVLPRTIDPADGLDESDREGLRRAVAGEIARGTRLARRLRDRSSASFDSADSSLA